MSLIQAALEKAGHLPDKIAAGATLISPSVPQHSIRKSENEKRSQAITAKPAVIRKDKIMFTGILAILIASMGIFLAAKNYNGAAPALTKPAQTNVSQSPISALMTNPISYPHFTLSGITSSDGERLALINNQVAGVGDRLKENAIVKKIDTRAVSLEYQGREIKLSL